MQSTSQRPSQENHEIRFDSRCIPLPEKIVTQFLAQLGSNIHMYKWRNQTAREILQICPTSHSRGFFLMMTNLVSQMY